MATTTPPEPIASSTSESTTPQQTLQISLIEFPPHPVSNAGTAGEDKKAARPSPKPRQRKGRGQPVTMRVDPQAPQLPAASANANNTNSARNGPRRRKPKLKDAKAAEAAKSAADAATSAADSATSVKNASEDSGATQPESASSSHTSSAAP